MSIEFRSPFEPQVSTNPDHAFWLSVQDPLSHNDPLPPSDVYTFGPFVLDTSTEQLWR